jgi:2-hydroxy-3-keto-5-methylthiopentenyl-1-phosphate phosphatase
MPRVLILDFDGTVTLSDVGDAVCEKFAPSEWRAIDDQWVRHEISLPEAQRRMWALARATREQAAGFLRGEAGRLRPGLEELLEAAAGKGVEVWLASGGFDFYIEQLLGPLLSKFARSYYSRAVFSGDRIAVSFPHGELACDRCAVCKGKVCDLARASGAEVLFAGDGHSDRCVVGRADRVAAVRGSHLERHLAEAGVAARGFERLDELADWL